MQHLCISSAPKLNPYLKLRTESWNILFLFKLVANCWAFWIEDERCFLFLETKSNDLAVYQIRCFLKTNFLSCLWWKYVNMDIFSWPQHFGWFYLLGFLNNIQLSCKYFLFGPYTFINQIFKILYFNIKN